MDGTSASCPQWAALVAVADQGRAILGKSSLDGLGQTLPALYSISTSGSFHDIVTGTSTGSPSYSAGPGYDLVTGLGSPVAGTLIPQLEGLYLPAVTAINPSQGSAAGGTSVTITGTNLGSLGTVSVNFGSAAGSVVSDTGTQIVATSPPGTAGAVYVTVVTPAGMSTASSADLFSYALANTSTAITTAAGSSTYGDSVTFAASVTPSGSGTPTGTVTFFDNGAALGTGLLNGSDIAAFTTSLLSAGSHSITASYGGDTSYGGSTAAGIGWTVNKASLAVTANNDSKTYGSLKTFAATAFTAVGLVTANGDTITGVTETSGGAAVSAGVAGSPYAIAITPGSATGTGLGNYTITYDSGLLTVSPQALTLTADNRTKTYGDSVTFAGTEFTSTGLVTANGDTITSVALTSPAAAVSAGAGGSPYTITITPGSAVFNPASAAGDYAITYNTGLFTVNAAAPVFSNLTGLAIPAGTATVTLSGTISLVPAGQSVSITLDGLTQTVAVDSSGNFSSFFDTHALATSGSPYTITYAYAGDTNLAAAGDASQTLIVDPAAVAAAPNATGGTGDMNVYGTPLSIPLSAGPYAGIGSYDGSAAANAGSPNLSLGSQVNIIDGTAASSTTLSMAWRTRESALETQNPNTTYATLPTPNTTGYVLPTWAGGLASDVVQMRGVGVQATDYVLQMSIASPYPVSSAALAAAAGQAGFPAVQTVSGGTTATLPNAGGGAANLGGIALGSYHPGYSRWEVVNGTAQFVVANGSWVNAVSDNMAVPAAGGYSLVDGKVQWVVTRAAQPPIGQYAVGDYVGSYAQFMSAGQPGNGHALADLRSSWGVDPTTHTVWAILNIPGGGQFAVVADQTA